MSRENLHKVVAIDGPAGAGKTTAAKALARSLDIHYLDTGALFRALAHKMLQSKISVFDKEAVIKTLSDTNLDIKNIDGNQHTILDGTDVSDRIRLPQVSKAASDIAVIPEVRIILTEKVRSIASSNSIVAEGRDIGTFMLPSANFKFYLTAAIEERARRRHIENLSNGIVSDYNEVLKSLKERDYTDMNREIAPLKKAEDAFYIDSTRLTVQQVQEIILNIICGGMHVISNIKSNS